MPEGRPWEYAVPREEYEQQQQRQPYRARTGEIMPQRDEREGGIPRQTAHELSLGTSDELVAVAKALIAGSNPVDIIAGRSPEYDQAYQEQQQALGENRPYAVPGLIDRFTHGLTAGLGPKITSHESAILGRMPEGGFFDYSQPYEQRQQQALQAERQQQAEFGEQYPVTSTAAELGGLLAGPGKALQAAGASRLVPQGMTGARGLTARSAATGADAAAIGAAEAYGADQPIGEGAAWTGAAGAALNPVSERVGRMLLNRNIRKQAPTRKQLKEQSGKLYDVMEANQVAFSTQFYNRLSNTIQNKLRGQIKKELHPKTFSIMKDISEEAQSGAMPTMRHLDMLRKQTYGQIKPALLSGNDDEARLLYKVIDTIDEFMDNPNPRSIITKGDQKVAQKALKEARDLWFRQAKAKDIEMAIELAEEGGYTTGVENTLRNQFNQIMRRGVKHKSYRNKFTDEEWEAVQRVATGGGAGGTQNLLRAAGKFGISFGNANSSLMPLLAGGGLAGGAYAAGINPAIAIPAIGAATASRGLADIVAKRGARTALGKTTMGPRQLQQLQKAGARIPSKRAAALAATMMREPPENQPLDITVHPRRNKQ